MGRRQKDGILEWIFGLVFVVPIMIFGVVLLWKPIVIMFCIGAAFALVIGILIACGVLKL